MHYLESARSLFLLLSLILVVLIEAMRSNLLSWERF